MKLYRKLVYLVVLLCFTSVVAAQAAACSDSAQQALAVVQQNCANTARNQACYGYLSLQATAQAGVQNFTFSQEGDLVDVADLASLQLTPFDPVKNTWGIALMKLQANLPDTLPGQNVTVLLFGNVQIQNAVSPSDTSGLQPMQAFYFQTSVGQTNCEGVPNDGILIQTPKGVGRVSLTVNNVDIDLGSTAYLEAQPDQQMSFYVVEGDSTLSYGGKTVDVPAGAVSDVPLDANLNADDVPTDPEAYDADEVADLPMDCLPDDITVAPPADDQTIAEANQETVLEATDQATAQATLVPFVPLPTGSAPHTQNTNSSGGD